MSLLLQYNVSLDAGLVPCKSSGPKFGLLPAMVSKLPIPEPSPGDRASRPRRSAALSLAAAGSLLLHAAVVGFAWLQLTPSDAIGGGGTTLEAISVEVIPAAALDARLAQPQVDASAAASQSIAETDGQLLDAAASPPPQETMPRAHALAAELPEPRQVEARTPADQETEPRDMEMLHEAVPDIASALLTLPTEPPWVPPEPIEKPRESPPETVQSSPPPSVPSAGGAAARGMNGQTGASAAATARPGALRRYAMAVSKALESAKAKSRPQGRRGRAIVRFVLTEDGELALAELTRASGDAAVDKAALDLLRKASFPEPPAGATRAELTYTVPVDFR